MGLFGGGKAGVLMASPTMQEHSRKMVQGSVPQVTPRKAGLFGGNAPMNNRGPMPGDPEQERGVFGRIADRVGNGIGNFGEFLTNERNGVSGATRLAAAGAHLRDDPSIAIAMQDRIARQESMFAERQRDEEERIGQQKQRGTAVQQAMALVNEVAPGNRALINEAMRNPGEVITMLAERSMQTPEAPDTRQRVDGGFQVYEQFNPQANTWEEVSRGPRWDPSSGASSDRISVGDIGGRLLDRMARGESLTPDEERAWQSYQELRRAPDPFAQMLGAYGMGPGGAPSAGVPGAAQAPSEGGASGAQGPSAQSPARIQSEADFNALPSGAFYVNPADGQVYRKN